jgi:very-short-patch-repair endonuclease
VGRGLLKTSGVIKLQYLSAGKLRQAREMCVYMTSAEVLLWERLRRNQLGVKFRRQQIIEGYIADFYCEAARLIIEVDGAVHENAERKAVDEHRRNVFRKRGLRELRFSNSQVETELEAVISRIKASVSLR